MTGNATSLKFLAVKRIGRVIEPEPHFLSWLEAKSALEFIQKPNKNLEFLNAYRTIASIAFGNPAFKEISRTNRSSKTARDRGFVYRSPILKFNVGHIEIAISFSFTICMEIALQSNKGSEKSKSKLWFSVHFSSSKALTNSVEFQTLVKSFDGLAHDAAGPLKTLYGNTLAELFDTSVKNVKFVGNQFELLTFQEEDNEFLQSLFEIEAETKSVMAFDHGALSLFSRAKSDKALKSFAARSLFGAVRKPKNCKIEAQVCSDAAGLKAYYIKSTVKGRGATAEKVRYLGVTSGSLISLVDHSTNRAHIPVLAEPASVISAALASQIGSHF
jgi:hypothetical protein